MLLRLSFSRSGGLDRFRDAFSHLPTKNLPSIVRGALEAYDIAMSSQVIGGLSMDDVVNRDRGLDHTPVIVLTEVTMRNCANNELVVTIDDQLYARLVGYTRRANSTMLGLVNDAIALLHYVSTANEETN